MLVENEVHVAVIALVSTTLVTRRDATEAIAATV
jgi:hypothetical protein